MERCNKFLFTKKKIWKISYNNFYLGIIILIGLCILVPIVWSFGIVILYIVNRGYNFKTGECDSGLFCRNGEAYCSETNTLYLLLGCMGYGITGAVFMVVLMIVTCLVIFLHYNIFKCIYKIYRRRTNKEINPTDDI